MTPRPAQLRRPTGLARLWRHGDGPSAVIIFVAGLTSLLIVAAIALSLWNDSELSRRTFGPSFITSSEWDPAISQTFGALPFILGTLVTSVLALLLAVPVGIGVAVFLAELAPDWLRPPLGFVVELLAAVPSVVYGIWGLFVFIPVIVKPLGGALDSTLGFIPLFDGPMYGPSRLAAGLLLAIMILPTIAAVGRDVIRAVPRAQREGALALGATRWESIWQVTLPSARSGLLGAVVLGLARALGETIAVTMVIGNNPDRSPSLLQPGYTMASIIANEFTEATYDLYLQALIEIGLVLFAISLLISLVARLLIARVAPRTLAV